MGPVVCRCQGPGGCEDPNLGRKKDRACHLANDRVDPRTLRCCRSRPCRTCRRPPCRTCACRPRPCGTWCRRRRCSWGVRRRCGVLRCLPCGTCPTRACQPRSCHRGAPNHQRRRPYRWRSDPSPWGQRPRARPNPCRTCACQARPCRTYRHCPYRTCECRRRRSRT